MDGCSVVKIKIPKASVSKAVRYSVSVFGFEM